MSLPTPERVKDFDDVYKFFQDIKNRLGFEDLNAAFLRTVEPTTDSLDKGRFAFAEISNVPTIYYRNLAGTIYKWTGTAV